MGGERGDPVSADGHVRKGQRAQGGGQRSEAGGGEGPAHVHVWRGVMRVARGDVLDGCCLSRVAGNVCVWVCVRVHVRVRVRE